MGGGMPLEGDKTLYSSKLNLEKIFSLEILRSCNEQDSRFQDSCFLESSIFQDLEILKSWILAFQYIFKFRDSWMVVFLQESKLEDFKVPIYAFFYFSKYWNLEASRLKTQYFNLSGEGVWLGGWLSWQADLAGWLAGLAGLGYRACPDWPAWLVRGLPDFLCDASIGLASYMCILKDFNIWGGGLAWLAWLAWLAGMAGWLASMAGLCWLACPDWPGWLVCLAGCIQVFKFQDSRFQDLKTSILLYTQFSIFRNLEILMVHQILNKSMG